MQEVFRKIIKKLKIGANVSIGHRFADPERNVAIKTEDAISIVIEAAEKYGRNIADASDLMVIGALPSLYSLQEFEEEAIHRVVASRDDGWIPVEDYLPEEPHEELNDFDDIENALLCDELQGYIVTIADAEEATTLYYVGKGRWSDGRTDGFYKVIAWQPLPPTYKS